MVSVILLSALAAGPYLWSRPLGCVSARMQDIIVSQQDSLAVPEGYELVDSIIYIPVSKVDTSLVGKSVLGILPDKSKGDKSGVNVYQSNALVTALKNVPQNNRDRQIAGYRIRIFSDNRQTARTESEKTAEMFRKEHPDVPAYITYANPYFKITVGDFRSRSEATRFMKQILPMFPKAFVVKEGIEYPAVDQDNAVVADTVKVLRPKVNPFEE